MTRMLLLDDATRRKIGAAVTAARARPVPWETFRNMVEAVPQDLAAIALKDRPPGFEPASRAQQVLIPVGYRAAISFEDQPPGLCRHLSISVEGAKPGMTANVPAVLAIAEAFGFRVEEGLAGIDRVWIEEYEPGRWAINLLQLDHEREAPTERRQ
jgi:hypothetical protein